MIPFRELELEKTSSRTGCLKPCTYIEYSLKAVQKISTKNSSSLFLRMAESKISFKKELWVYDKISLQKISHKEDDQLDFRSDNPVQFLPSQ